MNCNYKVKLDDIQNKYKFNIFCTGSYNDSDLRKMIESVFYALPRTSGSGASVTLNDTARSYMHNELNATDTSQYSTTGKNKLQLPTSFNISSSNVLTPTWNNDGSITFTGTMTGGSLNYNGSLPSNLVLPAGTYTLSANGSSNVSGSLNARDNSGNVISCGFTGNRSITLTEQKTITQLMFYFNGYSGSINITFKVQLESGSSATDFEPYTNGASPNPDYPQVIHTITGDNEVVVCGKNLFDNSVERKNAYPNSSGIGSVVSYFNSSATYSYVNCAYVEANTQYTISWEQSSTPASTNVRVGVIVDKNNIVLEAISTWGNNQNYQNITPNNSGYLILATDINATNIQIEKGTATTYEPYKSNSVLLTLGDKEVCKIGDYEDKIFKAIKGNEVYDSLASEEKATLDYGKWYLRKNIGKVVLDGSEDWDTNNVNRYYLNNYSRYFYTTGNKNMLDIMSDIANKVDDNTLIDFPTNEFVIYVNWNGNIFFTCLNLTSIYTEEQWKSATAGHVIYGRLNTPVNELFNDTIQDQLEDIYNNMLSYEGQTNVSQVNEDLPFNINSTALKDLNNL